MNHAEIYDWKKTSWSIEVNENTPDALKAGNKLKGKIIRVTKLLDATLSEELRLKVDQGNFLLNNPYPKIRHIYEWYRGNYLSVEPTLNPSNGSSWGLGKYFTQRSEKAFFGYAAIGFFYATMEFLFKVFYAFGDMDSHPKLLDMDKRERYPYFNSNSRSWKEKFQMVLPIVGNPELSAIYKNLLRFKRDLRDDLFHGFGDSENYLVELEGIGLVPISYENLTQSVHYSHSSSDVEFIYEALQTFDEFDQWLKANLPWSCYIIYAESGLEIPFYGERLQEIKNALLSPNTFEKWLQNELDYRDYLRG